MTLAANSAQTEINKPVKDYLKIGGSTNECSYSIWFIIDEWTNNEKTLFMKTFNKEVKEYIGEQIFDDTVSELLFEVSFDKYVNNMNIFLPELNNNYKKSDNCKITTELLGETGTSLKDCKTMCSEYNYNTCSSLTFVESQVGTSQTVPQVGTSKVDSDVYFFTDFSNGVNFKGNQAYDEAMGLTESTGKCYLYSSSPVMPKNCFSGMTGKSSPYQVYDWEDFIYSNGVVSYIKEKCSLPIPLQKWTNLIIIIKNKIMEIYINGKLVKQCSLTTNINNTNDPSSKFTITPNGRGFNGSTINFNYWNKCLTTSEISKLSKKVS
jgi:hypothetical protein